jgi:hypothetical protein
MGLIGMKFGFLAYFHREHKFSVKLQRLTPLCLQAKLDTFQTPKILCTPP